MNKNMKRLPSIATPTYELTIPSTGKVINFRPFLVKEEKLLLIANESDDIKDKIQAIKQIVESCIFDDVNISTLATFDLEYIFIQIRAKSVGEISELSYRFLKCPENRGEKCKNTVPVNIDLSKIKVLENEDHKKIIDVTDDIKVEMKYPTFLMVETMKDISNNDINNMMEVVSSCIASIIQGDMIYDASEYELAELSTFLESLTQKQFISITEFFSTMPKLSEKATVKCNKCGQEIEVVLEGIDSFFE